ncbi:hypothetical protein KM043_016326 [Ampulex compressa]|nr:hypothetical protein KM043_016326 [Ampulex compressa]
MALTAKSGKVTIYHSTEGNANIGMGTGKFAVNCGRVSVAGKDTLLLAQGRESPSSMDHPGQGHAGHRSLPTKE